MNVMSAVMTILGKFNADWATIKKEMTDPKFMDRIKNLDKDNMSPKIMERIEEYTRRDDFLPAILLQKSVVAGAFCSWVKSVEEYHKALQIVRNKLAGSDQKLASETKIETQTFITPAQ